VASAKDLYEKARDLHRSGRLQEAMRLYRKTLSLDPNYMDALNNLGVIYIQSRMYPAARESFAKAIRLKPDYVDPHYNLACLDALQGRLRQSLAHLKKAVSLDQSVKEWAIKDADLRNLRGVPEFEKIIRRSGK
jgi:tetratricopeptide (TPR) repeat protein